MDDSIQVYDSLTFDAYRAIDALNASGMKILERSPAHFICDRENPTPSTPAQRVGTLAHLAALEPDRYAALVHVSPAFNRRSQAGKDQESSWRASLPPEAEVVTQEQKDIADGIAAAMRAHPVMARLLARGRAEQTLVWYDAEHNIRCKARLDWLTHDGWVVDLKTTTDARYKEFQRAAITYGYDLAAAHYMAGAARCLGEIKGFVFAVAEKVPPYGFSVYTAGESILLRGETRRQQCMTTYATCVATGQWPNYAPEVTVLDAPAWSLQN